MSHLIAYVGNEPENMACALFSARGALYSRGTERREGWGLGFVQGGDVLLQKRPRAETGEVDLYNLVKDLRADAVVGRVGFGAEGRVGFGAEGRVGFGAEGRVGFGAEGRVGFGAEGNTTAEDADPFRFRSWLFGSVGEVSESGFESVRDKLLESVPDFLRRNIRGRSPGELVFHLFLAFLHDAGSLDAPSPSPALVHGALRNSVAFLDRLLVGGGNPTAPSRLALVATNGRCLVAANGAHPMRYLPIEGISDCPVCHSRLDREPDDRRIPHESLRAVIFEANRSIEERGGWQNVPEGSVVIVGPDRVPVLSAL